MTTEELIKQLKSGWVLENVVGIVYCQRESTENISQQLKSIGIPTLNVVKDLLTKRKSKDKKLVWRYQALHQHPFLEIKTLTRARKYACDLRRIIKKTQRPSKKREAEKLKNQEKPS